MDKFDRKTYEIVRRLQNARLSLLSKQPFYGVLLLHMKFALDLTCETAYTDGERIAFNPDFMEQLSDPELEFVLMHEVLHAALGHPFRKQSDYDLQCYDEACDIVVNSNILHSFGKKIERITLKNFGVAMHVTPNGTSGVDHTVEEIYDELMKYYGKTRKKRPSDDGDDDDNPGEESDDDDDSDDGSRNSGKQGKNGGKSGKGKGKGKKSPDDSGDSDENEESENDSDENEESDDDSDNPGKQGKNGGKGGRGTPGKNGKGITTGKNGSGGGDVSEQALQNLVSSLLKSRAVHGRVDPNTTLETDNLKDPKKKGTVDDHSFWNGGEEDSGVNIPKDVWLQRMIEATDLVASSQGGKGRGTVPAAAQRVFKELTNPILDWRTILNEFVQEEINDYSFSPPDRRMDDCPFFLPDFNEKDESVKNLLFMIDTSGSMSDDQITECYSEIYGAITQFNGKLQGKLGFFDAVVVEPIAFEDEDEFKIIRPIGGGGTSFDIIFEYVRDEMQDDPPVSIVILTDGYAPFPEESAANGIPVLWIINNEDSTPPWGKIARLLQNKVP